MNKGVATDIGDDTPAMLTENIESLATHLQKMKTNITMMSDGDLSTKTGRVRRIGETGA